MLFLLTTLCTLTRAEVIYVDDDVVGANDGSSWIDAFTDLQDAITVAQVGDEIRVAQGIYTPTQNAFDRDAAFELKDGVTILGGYAGLSGMYPDFRHTEFFTTILSGDIDHNDLDIDPNSRAGNSRHVVVCMDRGDTAVLEGVTISGGYAGNARTHNYSDGRGGGLYCRGGCSPQLVDCVFSDNEAGSGAVYINGGSHPVFTRCIWQDNYANDGGAICVNRSSYLICLNHCIFRRNVAARQGGAIYADIMGEVRMVNCLFVANKAGGSGGAISCNGSNDGTGRSVFNLLNCTFYGNTFPTFDHPPTNTVTQPDGSRVYWSDSVISNCIFYNEPSEMAVSIQFGRSEPLIITSIYEKELEPGHRRPIPPAHDVLFVDPYGNDGILGTKDDDLRPAPGSPVIDSGTNQTNPPLPAVDLDSNPRILNGVVDIGAFEYAGPN